jgi:pimeloyl-ACP methyl ester carboxylesterase
MRLRAALAALPALLAATPAAAFQPSAVTFAAACSVAGADPGSRCGTLRVAENRARPAGRRLSLRFVIVPGRKRGAADPIVYIAGGPGESAVQSLPQVLPTLRGVDRDRDIVFLDQRGTGASNPLDCPRGMDFLSASDPGAALQPCVATLGERADLNHYSSFDAAADLDALRTGLGYRQIDLVAVSYGVRVALIYMREHPGHARTAILRAAYPIDYNVIADGTAAADAALAQLFDDCGRDPSCKRAFPGLSAQLRALDARLAGKPEDVRTDGPDGAAVQVVVTRELFHQLLLAMMQAATSRQYVPLLVHTAATRGFQPFATPIAQLREGLSGLQTGLYLSVLCAEDAPRAHLPTGNGRTGLFASAGKLLAACSAWPVRPAPARTLAPFASAVPTLIVSGALDPVTPAEGARRLAASLQQSAHFVLPATAHGPMFPNCARPAVAAFIRTRQRRDLGTACKDLAVPPFVVPAVAAPPASAAPAAPAKQKPASLEGNWDLFWQTRKGSSPGGYLVIRQSGTSLEADLHGKGSIRASGSVEGNAFTLNGSRLFVPYVLSGTLRGDAIEGVLKVMSVERHFVGRRRVVSPAPAQGR